MRKGLFPTSLLTLGLIAALPAAAAAQDAAPTEAAFLTGTIGDSTMVGPPSEEFHDGGIVVRELVRVDSAVEATDPRLAGTLSRELAVDVHFLSDIEDFTVQSFVYLIENDEGTWSGTGTALTHGGRDIGPEDGTNLDTVILTGSGAYDGLSAYLLADWTEDPTAFEAAIFPGEVPAFPKMMEPGSAPVPNVAADQASLDGLLADVVGDAPGGLVSVVTRGGDTLTSTAGVANAAGDPVDADTAYRVGGVTVPFVATIVMQLVDEGLVDLDATLKTYLPNTKVGGDATVRQLLSGYSGVPDYIAQDGMLEQMRADTSRTYTPDDVIDMVVDLPQGMPGEGFAWSHTNYILLGQLIEAIDGTDLNGALQARIVEPLGLRTTTFELADSSQLAAPWVEGVFDGDPTASYESFASSAWAAGGLISSANDLATFITALFDGQLTSEASLAEMLRVGDSGWGLGVGTLPPGSEPGGFYGADGYMDGYISFLGADPDTGDVVVVVSSGEDVVPWWAIEGLLAS